MKRMRCMLVAMTVWVCLSTGVSPSQAQTARDVPVNIRGIEFDMVRTPEYNVSGVQNRAGHREWLKVFAQYETDEEWLDSLTFTYYILFRNKESRDNPYRLYRGQVEYLNIKDGRHMSEVFMHPSVPERYDEPEFVGLEVSYQGRLVARVSEPERDERWWERFSPIDGQVLMRKESPFGLVNIELYEFEQAVE